MELRESKWNIVQRNGAQKKEVRGAITVLEKIIRMNDKF